MKTAFFMNVFVFSLHSFGLMTVMGSREKVIALNHITSRLALGKMIILHHDPDVPADVLNTVMASPGMQDVPLVALECNSSYFKMQVYSKIKQSGSTSRTIHIFLFLKHKPKLIKFLCSSWAPRYLVLYSLAQVDNTSVLREAALDRVEKLVLIAEDSSRKQLQFPSLVVYTIFPFP